MSNQHNDLDLLLSLDDRVPETPPASPTANSSGYLSDDGLPRKSETVDMSIFRNAVKDCLNYEHETANKSVKFNKSKSSKDPEIEKFSGLRIRNQEVSQIEMNNCFADIRFVRLPVIKNLLIGDTLSGCWATIGVLTEKGSRRTSYNGKAYCIWKIGCLDEKTVSVFLFGDAYQKNCKEEVGTIFALFNCNIRKDNLENGFSLSVYSARNILKIGTSMDYGVCKGKRKNGMACTVAINKRYGMYCVYHRSKASEKYSVTRTELKGGNLRTAFRDLKSEGIYLVNPMVDKTNLTKSKQPLKVLSVEGLKKALSNADKVTTNVHSQGIRFLTKIAGKIRPKTTNEKFQKPKQPLNRPEKRSLSTVRKDPPVDKTSRQVPEKRSKGGQGQHSGQQTNLARENMIELEYVSSDEDISVLQI